MFVLKPEEEILTEAMEQLKHRQITGLIQSPKQNRRSHVKAFFFLD